MDEQLDHRSTCVVEFVVVRAVGGGTIVAAGFVGPGQILLGDSSGRDVRRELGRRTGATRLVGGI